ncbi:NAC domain-containing protein 83-like [Rhododendron vialii]|uniref:NAC domain-containing protein 83-like n=1 Tax=Rhododendron vialii TaxID=182163 RepID=UPI00265E5E48|nr:NAC domain-containing protein 83-like [Rhododendron vialii]
MDTKPASLVKNGGILKIPVGFRFHPTDDELLVHYLKRKVHSLPLPAAVIPELDVFQYNPWDLPGDSKEKRYFFFGKRNSNVNRCNQMISAGSGHWKGIGKEKQVMASSGSNQTASIIGVRKTLVFFKGKKRPRGFRSTHWIMHEFQLMGSSATTLNACQQKLMTEMEGWAVCCIHRKKAKSKRSSTRAKNGNTTRKVGIKIRPSSVTTDMATKDNSESGPPDQPSSPSCSSEITE